jgi:hypothetical protein
LHLFAVVRRLALTYQVVPTANTEVITINGSEIVTALLSHANLSRDMRARALLLPLPEVYATAQIWDDVAQQLKKRYCRLHGGNTFNSHQRPG